jgi:homoserine kinase
MSKSVTVFAPATIANVAVGFDILGFSVEGVGDEVTVAALDETKKVEITDISGVVTDLPKDSLKNSGKNTASVALQAMIRDLGLSHGFSVRIKKGIAMGSGMGGSAASAVGAVVAANELLVRQFSRPVLSTEKLLRFSLLGEAAASGSIHGDNVGPCLQGGLTLLLGREDMRMISIPVPKNVYAVLVHPDLEVKTQAARGILKPEVPLALWVEQSSRLAAFVSGCFRGDPDLIRASMKDVVIEPQRSHLIPGFAEMKAKAHAMGALGFSISGSGPSVFAWIEGRERAQTLAQGCVEIFARHRLASQFWVTSLDAPGARVIA